VSFTPGSLLLIHVLTYLLDPHAADLGNLIKAGLDWQA